MRNGLPFTVERLTPGQGLAVVCSEECEPPGASFERTHVRRVDPGLFRFVCGMDAV